MTDRLIVAYQEMYEHTNPECAKCPVPHLSLIHI